MKLWDKGYSTSQKIEAFTVGDDREFDLLLAKYDVKGSLAHTNMLTSVGLLTQEEGALLEKELNTILQEIESGNFEIEEEFEDVHSKVEFVLTERLGDPGKKIHTARSRNDQVLVDLHLFLKDEIREIASMIKTLFDVLITNSNTHKDVILPGYTHLQVAMPSSFGLWFAAYAESFIDDLYMLEAAFKVCDQNPLGSAAGYGSSFPIDRTLTTELLEFKQLKYNVVAAQMSRGKLEKSVSFALASIAGTLSRFAMDSCLYMSQNFGFISLPNDLTTGSSIMPHKKNPDVFELIRGKCNKIQSLPTELTLITNNLPSGYHRDYQLLKESLFPALLSLKSCLDIMTYAMEHVKVNKKSASGEKYDFMYSVEKVNEAVMQGHSFRDAYKLVGKQIADGNYEPSTELNHTHEGSLGNLCNDGIVEKMNAVFGVFG